MLIWSKQQTPVIEIRNRLNQIVCSQHQQKYMESLWSMKLDLHSPSLFHHSYIQGAGILYINFYIYYPDKVHSTLGLVQICIARVVHILLVTTFIFVCCYNALKGVLDKINWIVMLDNSVTFLSLCVLFFLPPPFNLVYCCCNNVKMSQ